MKKKSLIILLMSLVMTMSMFSVSYAATNPYNKNAKWDGKWANCTYWAWQYAYDKAGVALPGFSGNADSWYNAAKNAGYCVGSTPKAKSIAVWKGLPHVAYVSSVNGSKIYVYEGGYSNSADGRHEGWVNPKTIPNQPLVGYIHLHKLSASTSTTATCTKAGKTTTTCKICGEKTVKSVGALGHSYKHYTTPAQIGIKGSSYDKCTRCGAIINKVSIPELKPNATTITSIKGDVETFDVTWTKKSYTGYQVRYSKKSDMSSASTVNVPKASTNRLVVITWDSKKTYYVQVRTYKTVNGTKWYSAWSTKKSVKTK